MFIVLGALLAALGVAAGAFGAHALADSVSPERIKVFDTAARYHLIHSLALVLTGIIAATWPSTQSTIAGYLFLAGIAIFSGSLYLLVLTDTSWLGAVTPLGGLALIAAWCMLAWGATRLG